MAFESFTATDIRVEGLRRLSPGTVFNYLPISVNDQVDRQTAAEAMRALYDTGFFQDIELARDGDVLVVNVVERPSIARIEIFGNTAIQTDPLMEALREIGLAEGETFNRSLLDNVENELRAQYFGQGRYDVEVSSTVSPLPRNRVGIRIDVDEGESARIREVHFVGNQAFTDRELRRLFELGPRPWYLPFSRRDRYARERLSADLERLRSYYLNRGYVNFAVTSTQVSLSPDRQSIYVTVNLSEGDRFRLGDVEVVGDLIVEEDELLELLELESGAIFSQADITRGSDRIRTRLGVEGYAFANVNAVPDIDRDTGLVNMTYYVDPGARAYVRRINISGNYRTDDEVIRREFRQLEGGWFSGDKIRLSRTRLNRLGFFESVNIETPQVPGQPDQVDVNVDVVEGLSGSLQAGVGYGSGAGVLLNLSVAQDNVLGTGDRMGVAANRSDDTRLYQINYTDRYYNVDGVTRHFSAFLRDTNLTRRRLSDYNLRSGNVQVGLGVPLNEEDQIRFDVGYEDIRLSPGSQAPSRITDFVDEFGDTYQNFKLLARWSRNTTDRFTFPSAGGTQEFGGEVAVPGSDLTYYKANYSNRRYFGVTENTTLSLFGRASYGEGYGDFSELPFFENYFNGGIQSVRGYRVSSLGPRDDEDGRPIGGNFRVNSSIEYFFPPPFIESNAVRFSLFVDAGQVYNTKQEDIDLDRLRYSAGTAFTWISPLGPLTMSYAWPLNDEPEDNLDRFQFSIGTFF
ncbi:outer membrane protein insertion porin family [Natronocella acetinitrilica]|uniref:Outer membrane protein assembly factor BamA n=2 Tax=Natronocella acetinitrilica TaxID=414046 RepID=A0AAE3G6W4_9GAMM|nr:outer membrane protein insertion porin family [Natronocella acetinitrilica]